MPTSRSLRIIACLALLGLILAPAIALAQESGSYSETFDSPQPPDWKLDSTWSVDSGVLYGRDFGRAEYVPGSWHDAHYHILLKSFQGNPHLIFMDDGKAWYYLYIYFAPQPPSIAVLSQQLVVELYYTTLGQEFPPKLADGSTPITADDIKLNGGIAFDLDVLDREIDLQVNHHDVFKFASDFDAPPGTIGFEVGKGALIAVDEVSVDPAPAQQPSQPPSQPPTQGADLAIRGISLDGVRRGSVIADLSVEVANEGDAESRPTQLVVYDSEQPDVRVVVDVESIPPGSGRTFRVSLEGPDDWDNTVRRFVAEIDPDNLLGETNRANNRFVTDGLTITVGGVPLPQPQPQPQPGPGPAGPDPGTVILIIGALVMAGLVVGGGTIAVVRNQMKIGERRQLQKEAKEGQPPDHCTPPGRYVQAETEVELKLMKITQLEVALVDSGSKATRRKVTVKDKLPADLNAAIHARWLREPQDNFAARLQGLTKNLASAVADQAYREKDLCDVAVSAHLEGIELKTTFTLYRCVKSGADGVWKKVTSWEVKKTQERDDAVLGLAELDTGATSMATRLEVLMLPMLKTFVEKY